MKCGNKIKKYIMKKLGLGIDTAISSIEYCHKKASILAMCLFLSIAGRRGGLVVALDCYY